MTQMEPDDRDEFEALMKGIDFGELADAEVVDYTELSTLALEDMLESVKEQLYARGEMLAQTSGEGMDLSNIYNALIAEKNRRRGLV